ncbi:MAG: hypothetical protein WBZ36_24100, partial [Candidatus Nitrosopolaris sp.]
VQGYGRSIRSKEDYAVTYVLDSGFENFAKKNKNILPDWFTQAIQSDLLKAPLEHAAFDGDSSKVSTPSEENHNQVRNNYYNSPIISEQTLNNNTPEKSKISFYIAIKASEPSGALHSNNNDENNNRLEQRLFICPYCPNFKTTLESEYQRHIVLNHPGKSGYYNMAAAG